MTPLQETSLGRLLIGVFVCILSYSLLIYIFIIYPLEGDKASSLASMFGFSAMLFAPVAAYFLIDDWKNPLNFSIENDYKREILKKIRLIRPLEYKYDRLLSNYSLYKGNPGFTIPIDITDRDVEELIDLINELLGLIEEYYLLTEKDESIKDIKDRYYNYAQLYNSILRKSDSLYKNDESGTQDELLNFLGTELKFEYKEDGISYTSSTLYAYAFKGINNTKITQFFTSRLKAK